MHRFTEPESQDAQIYGTHSTAHSTEVRGQYQEVINRRTRDTQSLGDPAKPNITKFGRPIDKVGRPSNVGQSIR